MKPSLVPLLCSALLFTVTAGAQPDRKSADQVSLSIIKTEEPVFPRALLSGPVLNGHAKVAIDVDENGQIADLLVTGYSRKEFADAAVEVLRRWRYVPPSIEGRPWASVRELNFDYSRTGVVVNFVGTEAMDNRIAEMVQRSNHYRTYALRDLDRIPTPLEVVTPVAPALQPAEPMHLVTVEFFIDEQGRVRLPAVSREEAGSVYAASALAAVRQWRFSPPTIKGRPVLVLVTQQFKFVPQG
jgi:TonB family protein